MYMYVTDRYNLLIDLALHYREENNNKGYVSEESEFPSW